MTFASIQLAYTDPDLRKRVDAAVYKEAVYTKSETYYGQQVLQGYRNDHPAIYWRVATDTEAAYESALLAGRGAAGHDSDIITDAAITSAVVAGWPPDPPGVAAPP
jgi:hypothetical protein